MNKIQRYKTWGYVLILALSIGALSLGNAAFAEETAVTSEADQSTENLTNHSEDDATQVSDEDVKAQSDEMAHSPTVSGWMIAILFLSLLLTAMSLTVTFFLYRWRKNILLTGAMVPEEWAGILKDVVEGADHVASNQITVLKGHEKLGARIHSEMTGLSKDMSDIQQTLMAFQGALDTRDQEISRLKDGYDAAILSKYFSRLVNVMDTASKLSQKEGVGQKEMKNISLMILDLLELGGVEEFAPECGADFADLGDEVVPHKLNIETDDPKKHGKVESVVSKGFRMVSGEKTKILKPSIVQVFINKKDVKI